MLKNSPIILFFALLLSLSCLHAQLLTFEQARSQADSGDARAQAVVAMHYSLGWEVSKNPQKAVEYALKSARSGEALGLFRMGTLLRNGEGVPKNEEEGLKLQLEAVKLWNNQQSDRLEGGDPYCLAAAGILIFQGKVVDDTQQNRYNTAAQLYRKAADAGLAPAQYNYAMCLIEGQGVDKNFEEAVKFIVMSAMSNYPLSIKWLQEKNSDIPTAKKWLEEKGIDIGNQVQFASAQSASTYQASSGSNVQREVPPPQNQRVDSKSAEFRERFIKKSQVIIAQLAQSMHDELIKPAPVATNVYTKLEPSNGKIADWLENSFVAENLEAKDNPSYQNVTSNDKPFAYAAATLPSQVLPLVSEKKFSAAKQKIQEYLNGSSGVSTQLKQGATDAFKNSIEYLNKPIANSDELREKSNQAAVNGKYDDAIQLLQRANAIDNRDSDSKAIEQFQEKKKKNAFESEIGL